MQKINSFISLMLLIILTACSGDKTTNNEQKSPVETTKEVVPSTSNVPTYTVAIENSEYMPFIGRNKEGQQIGYDIDLIRAIGEESGFIVEFVPIDFSEILDYTKNNKVDLAIDGLTLSKERQKTLLASKPYVRSQTGFLVKEEQSVSKPRQIRGEKVSVVRGSHQEELIQDMRGMKKEDIVVKKTVYLAFQSVFTDEAFACLGEAPLLHYYASVFKEHPIKFIPLNKSYDDLVIYSSKENKEIIEKINMGLDTIIKNGKYQKLNEKWFGKHAQELSVENLVK